MGLNFQGPLPTDTAAMDRFLNLGLPHKRMEDWRHTDLAPFFSMPFQLSQAAIATSPVSLTPYTIKDAHEVVFINGHFAPSLSRLHFPAGVVFSPTLSSTSAATNSVASLFQDEALFHMNQAFHYESSVCSLFIPDGISLSMPIHLLYLSTIGDRPWMTHPRNMLDLGTGSKVQLIETYACAEKNATVASTYFTNACTFIHLKRDAVLSHIKIQKEGPQSLHLQNTGVSVQGNASYSFMGLNFGGQLSRQTLKVELLEESAQVTLEGLSELDSDQEADMVSTIFHRAPNTVSEQLQKNILRGKSHAVFQGKILVDRAAQKTSARQLNKNLILSPKAHVNTRPQLQIGADDVKCTHGATIGQIRPEEVFYLESRGFPPAAAREILTEAFAQEVKLKVLKAAPFLEGHLSRKEGTPS